MPAKVDTTAPKAALKDRIASFLDGGRTSGRLSGRNSFSSTPAASTAASTPASTPRKQESNLMDRLGGLFGGRKDAARRDDRGGADDAAGADAVVLRRADGEGRPRRLRYPMSESERDGEPRR